MHGHGPFDELREVLAGELILPGDPAYDDARSVFNAMIDRRPAVIAQCRATEDVAIAVNYARENGLEVAVRCGGHSVSGLSVCEGGIVIDLAGLKKIQVDPLARTARAGGGVLWGEFDAATQEHGLHTPGGRVTTTGIGGFTTGGGYGWTSSKHGLACDNLISAEVVLADGSVVRASEREQPDLDWTIRGGGGNSCGVGPGPNEKLRLLLARASGHLPRPVSKGLSRAGVWRCYTQYAPHVTNVNDG